MIVISVDIWPMGNKEKAYPIGRAKIWNVGGNIKRGFYEAAVNRRGDFEIDPTDPAAKAMRTGKVDNYPRLSYNMWRLVIRALLSCFPEEDKS